MSRRILVAVDGGEATEKVLEAVRRLAAGASRSSGANGSHDRDERVDVTVVHVVPPYLDTVRVQVPRIVQTWLGLDVEALLRDVAVRQGEAVVEQAASSLEQAGIQPRVRVLVGQPAESICHEAEQGEYDLVVLGRREMTPLERLTARRVSDYVKRHCKVPVLVVH